LKFLRLLVVLLLVLSACQIDGSGLVVAPGWVYHSLGAWKYITPNQIALSSDGRWLYFGSETSEFTAVSGVVALNASNGHTHLLVDGLDNVKGMRFAPDGSLWVAEGSDQGEIWRMAEPEHFPDNQHVNALTRESTYPGFSAFRFAGRFAHKAIAFSADKRYAYLADVANGGSLYRLDLRAHKLTVLHRKKGWLDVIPEDAVSSARTFGAEKFAAIACIERMPDGSFLLSESGAGRILKLDDHGAKPMLSTWLKDQSLQRPVDLSWDKSRQWLWITDEGSPSVLWAWDGRSLHEVLHHSVSRISGVLASDGKVYVSLQRGPNNPAMIFILKEKNRTPE